MDTKLQDTSGGNVPPSNFRKLVAGAAPLPASMALPAMQRRPPRLNKLKNIYALADFEAVARQRLPRPIFGYFSGAAETNAALQDNERAFREWGFTPKVLAGVGGRTSATTLFGKTYAAPFGIAPMGLSALASYRGDLVLTTAAAQENVPMIMSSSSLIRLESIATANPSAWFQAYLPGEPERITALVDRVSAAGFRTLVLTVDTIISGNRENIMRSGFSTPLRPSLRIAWDGLSHPSWLINTFLQTLLKHGMPHFENSYATRGAPIISSTILRDFGARDHLSWEHVEIIRKRWSGTLVIKGIMRPEDACLARDHGADGIILSNHGGRQLNSTVSPLRILPQVVSAIGGVIPVMMDSGFRRGTDVLKAIALGADFVFVGRPFLYAAAVAGEVGVRHAIQILSEEVTRNMGLMGINTLSEIKHSHLHRLPA